jgi:DnaK suppressor protein
MARRDALLRLHKALTNRRAELLKRLGMELSDLGHTRLAVPSGDSADAAFDSGSDELASKLAELEARELHQINRALVRLKNGSYGACEGCHAKIPVARLNALPYSTLCIKCQRELESGDGADGRGGGTDWGKISDVEPATEDHREVDLSEIEMDLSK